VAEVEVVVVQGPTMPELQAGLALLYVDIQQQKQLEKLLLVEQKLLQVHIQFTRLPHLATLLLRNERSN
jgi:hypothetical protein